MVYVKAYDVEIGRSETIETYPDSEAEAAGRLRDSLAVEDTSTSTVYYLSDEPAHEPWLKKGAVA